jgi:hippurate hydrolase
VNDTALVERVRGRWLTELGDGAFADYQRDGMGGEDFPFLTTDPYIPSVYFQVGGTSKQRFEEAAGGGPPVPSHHSPLFEITPEPAVKSGVIATVIALRELLQPE